MSGHNGCKHSQSSGSLFISQLRWLSLTGSHRWRYFSLTPSPSNTHSSASKRTSLWKTLPRLTATSSADSTSRNPYLYFTSNNLWIKSWKSYMVQVTVWMTRKLLRFHLVIKVVNQAFFIFANQEVLVIQVLQEEHRRQSKVNLYFSSRITSTPKHLRQRSYR